MGIFKKPKAPPPTAQEKELELRQRAELNKLQREENERLKAIKRGQRGRRSLLGSPTAAAGAQQGGRSRVLGGGVRGRAGGQRGPSGGGTGAATGGASRGGILGSGSRGARGR